MRLSTVLLAGTLVAAMARGAAPPAPPSVVASRAPIRFIEDDYARALAQAREAGRPMFVEIWAKWCHTCRSMRAYVLSDSSLSRQAGRYVWLSIDGEQAANAEFRRRFPIQAYPTYLIVDPATQVARVRWVGGATIGQLHALLDEAAAPRRSEFDGRVATAERLYGAGDNAAAVPAYREVLASAPKDWPGYGRAVESLLFALQTTEAHRECVELADGAYDRLRHTPSAVNVAASGLGSALELPADDPQRRERVATFERRAREVLMDSTLVMAGDDRSGLLATLVDARRDAGDSLGARRALEDWASALEREAGRARTPEQRAVYDSHRLSAYLDLGQPERAIGMLQTSERDFPDDYNPPARLAVALKAMGRLDEALAAADRALPKAYGPRKLRVYRTRAEILAAHADSSGARRTLEQAMGYAESLPEGQRSAGAIAELKRLLGQAP
jgi:thioredoxin-like negative regulator of GroEL